MIDKNKLSLDRPVVYQVKIPGHLQGAWQDWVGEMAAETSCDETGESITTLTGKLDQAALIGLLRRLYSLGLPLISIVCLEDE